MTLSYVIIHEIDKKQNKTGADLHLYEEPENNVDNRVIELVTELNKRYRYRDETYAVFDKKYATDFYKGFSDFSADPKLATFIAFSKKATQALHGEIKNIAPARGGYLVFARYREAREFVGVFLVRNTTGTALQRPAPTAGAPRKLKVAPITHIDFENLAMACRINLDAYGKRKVRYLSFINRKSDEISQYFARWISTRDSETNKEDTTDLYSLFKEAKLPVDEDTGMELTRPELLTRVYKSIRATPGRAVNLRTLSEQFYKDADYLGKLMDEKELSINGEFKAHPGALRRFIEVHIEAEGIDLTFPPGLLNTKIRFDDTKADQIIIQSAALVQQLRQSQ